jgi:DNA repair protein RadC
MTKKVMEMAAFDRPREKLVRLGAAALRDEELVAILLGSGNAQMDVMAMARTFVRHVDGKGLDVTIDDLKMPGVGTAKAAKILAAIEFVRRRIKPSETKILETRDILPLVRHFAFQRREHVVAITINGANEVMGMHTVAIGSLDKAPLDPREVFSQAIAEKASGVILAHNHPEGGIQPSEADVEATARIKDASAIVGVPLLDHVIFNRTDYFSFVENGML